jgi:putative ABC transport system substrate-binding protein
MLAVDVLIASRGASAQAGAPPPRIGFLMSTSPAAISDRFEAFRQGLRDLGYVEGSNIVVEYRWADGRAERLPGLAAELVRLRVHLIVTAGPTVTRAAQGATPTIPIVMGFDSDPVGNGFVASLARPGRNITGLSTLLPEISGKQLELLKEIVPRLSRVTVLGTSNQPGTAQALKAATLAAETSRVQLHYVDVLDAQGIERALREASRARSQAVLTLPTRVLVAHRPQLLELAAKSRLPVVYYEREYVEQGGLLSYGVSYADLYRRTATYVDKILKGARPADLPVEQPTKFELVVNLRTAKALGITIPTSILLRADEVIQ